MKFSTFFNIDKLVKKHNVSKKQLLSGIRVEKEHTSDEKVAAKIAIDHLKEDPEYYTKLLKAGL